MPLKTSCDPKERMLGEWCQNQRKRKGAALPMCSPSHTEARAKLDVCPFAVKLPIKQTESVRLCTTKKTKKTKAFSLPPMINLGWGRRILFNSYLLCTVTSPFHTPSTHTHTHTFPFSPSSSPPPLSSTRFLLVCKGGLTSLPMAAPQALTALGSHVAPTVRPLGQHVVVPGCALSRNP